MTSDQSQRSRTLPLLVAATALATLVWGAYAWRSTQPSADVIPPEPSELASKSDPQKVTPLRATRPISEIIKKIESENAPAPVAPPAAPQADGPTPDAIVAEAAMSAVSANAPMSSEHSVEMTLTPKVASKPPEVVAPATAENSAVATLLAQGRALLGKGELIEARAVLSRALDKGLPASEENWIRAELGRVSEGILFSRATNTGDPVASTYVITSGDTLNRISAKHDITEELLAGINQIKEANKLHVGQRLKVINGPFHLVIDKSDHRMDVFLGDLFVRSFTVGLGANGYTPTGTWIVNNKLQNPDWTDPNTNRHYLADDPDNPIGERWIGLNGTEGDAIGKTGFGIHGTIDPNSIGRDKSMGCIRMAAADVNLVYDLVVLNRSTVVIRP